RTKELVPGLKEPLLPDSDEFDLLDDVTVPTFQGRTDSDGYRPTGGSKRTSDQPLLSLRPADGNRRPRRICVDAIVEEGDLHSVSACAFAHARQTKGFHSSR